MKKYIILTLMVLLVALTFGCSKPAVEETNPDTTAATELETTAGTESTEQAVQRIKAIISPEEAQKLIGQEGVYLIDVRTVEEYSEGHIPGSMNIPLDKLESIQMIVPYADKTMIVYCRSGNRSAQAADLLESYGYLKIYDLGGIINWPYGVE
jgi:phage shock protein E